MAKFGETVKGYDIPVLNEREIRASAGILFLFAFIAIMIAIFKGDFLLLKYFIISFLVDFIVRVFVSPKYAPTLIIGRLIVNKQVPEYVGATQKKFAWIIGLILAVIMLLLIVVLNTYSVITGLICLICLVFLFFESAFGICLGCLSYKWIYKEKAQYCPGEICDINDRQDIQKTTLKQLVIVLAYVIFIVVSVFIFNDIFSESPRGLLELFE